MAKLWRSFLNCATTTDQQLGVSPIQQLDEIPLRFELRAQFGQANKGKAKKKPVGGELSKHCIDPDRQSTVVEFLLLRGSEQGKIQ